MSRKKHFKISRILHLDSKPLDPSVLKEMAELPSDRERFDRFLKEDLRLPVSKRYIDFDLKLQLDLLRFRLLLGAKYVKNTRNFLQDQMRKYPVPLKIITVFSIPFIGYYLGNPEVQGNYNYRLHTSMPGVAIALKTPSSVDWSTVVGCQFYHQIIWNQVGISDFRNDSVFVLFSPSLGFTKKEQYVACCETEEFNQQQSEKSIPTDTKTIDLVKTGENTYGPKPYEPRQKTWNPVKQWKNHFLLPLNKQKTLLRHREKATICPDLVQQYLNAQPSQSDVAFGNMRPINTIPTYELKKIGHRRTRNFLGFKFRTDRKIHATHFQPHLLPATLKIPLPSNQKPRITNLVASRDHHLLISPKHVETLNKTLNSDQPIDQIKQKLYWQPFYSSYDLIPSKMESMTFANKPRLSVEEQYRLDMKTYDKDSKSVDSSCLIPSHKKSRDKRKKLYEKQLSEEKAAHDALLDNPDRYDAQPVLSLERELKPNTIKLLNSPKEQNNLIGLNTETLNSEKQNLVGETRHKTFDWHVNNPYSFDQLTDNYKHRHTLKANWKHRIKQRYLKDHPEWWAQVSQKSIAPLFDVSTQKPVSQLKHVNTTVDRSKLAKQDPPSKIFQISEAIQENFQKALDSKISVRQSSRYLIFNSLFNFNHLVRRNLYLGKTATILGERKDFETKPLTWKPDFILASSNKTPSKFKLQCLKPALLYETLLEDRHWFNPYENFPYDKIHESKGIHPNTFQPGELYTESNLQHREKVLAADAKRTVRYGLEKATTKKKIGRNKSRKIKKTKSKIEKNINDLKQIHLSKNANEKLDKNQKSIGLKEFKLKHIGLFEQIIKQKLERKQESLDRILAYAKVVYHPFFNKTKPEIQQMIDERNTSNLKKLKKINDKFEAETFGKIQKIKKELELMQNHRQTYYTELIELFYSFQETVNQTLSELKQDPKLPNYFYSFPGDSIEFKNYQKQQKEMLAGLENHPIFEFLRSRKAPNEPAYLKREKSLLEMCHSKWRNEPFAKSYEQTRDKIIDRFFAQFPYKEIPAEYKYQAFELFETELINNFNMITGKLTTFDVSEQRFIFRDKNKLASTYLGKETSELNFPFELCTANEIIEPHQMVEANEQFTIKPHFDKFRFDSFRLKYQRFLLTNPFRILPITQHTLFSNITRDLIKTNFYQHYTNWYQQFFLQNLNFIKPVSQLDQIIDADKHKAYLNYSKKVDPSLCNENLETLINDVEIENMLNARRIQAEKDKKQTEAIYKQQAEEKFKNQDYKLPYYLDYYDNPVQMPVHDPLIYDRENLAGEADQPEDSEKYRPDFNYQKHREVTWDDIDTIEQTLKQDYLKAEHDLGVEDDLRVHLEPAAENVAKINAGKNSPSKPWDLDFKYGGVNQQKTSNQTNQINNQPEEIEKIQNLTLEQLFKDQLLYYLKSPQKPDDLFEERFILDENQTNKLNSKSNPLSQNVSKTEKHTVDNKNTLAEPSDLEQAYEEISKAFGWTEKPLSQEAYQSKLNEEIAEAFIQKSQQIAEASKSQKELEAEYKTKQAIRSRIIQGHSPYLQRQMSGYINPDASFRLKNIELLGWDNVFEKARQMYQLSQESHTNIVAAAKFSFIKRLGKLSTINSPFYQISSALPAYHYECFSRLINNRTTALFDFKALNLHTISKASDPSRSTRRVNFHGITKTQTVKPVYEVPNISKKTKKPFVIDNDPFSVASFYDREHQKENQYIELAKSQKDLERLITETEEQNRYKRHSLLRQRGLLLEDILASDSVDFREILCDSPKMELIKNNAFRVLDLIDDFREIDKNLIKGNSKKEAKESNRLLPEVDFEIKDKTISSPKYSPRYEWLDRDSNFGSLEDSLWIEEDDDWAPETKKRASNLIRKLNRKRDRLNKIIEPSFPILREKPDIKSEEILVEEEEDSNNDPEFNTFYELYKLKPDERYKLSFPKTKKRRLKENRELSRIIYSAKAKAQKKLNQKPTPKQTLLEKLPFWNSIKNGINTLSESNQPINPSKDKQESKPSKTSKASNRKFNESSKLEIKKLKKFEKPTFVVRQRTGYAGEVSPLYKYKNNIGIPNSRTLINTPDEIQLLLDANALMNKVRHRYFYGTASGYIDHSRFDYAHGQKQKWRKFQHVDSRLVNQKKSRNLWRHRMLLLNVSVTNPAFWGYLFVLYWLAQHFDRFRRAYEGGVSNKFVDLMTRVDGSTVMAFFRTNKAIVHCKGIGFDQIVGGKRLVGLFYPVILANRNKHFSFGTLPVFQYSFLQKIASQSVGFVRVGSRYELSVSSQTEEEIELARKFGRLCANPVVFDEQHYLLIGPPGTGKTFFVKALASESHIPVIIPSRHEFQYVKNAIEFGANYHDKIFHMRQFFSLANRQSPCVLFIDEIDALGPTRIDLALETPELFYEGPKEILPLDQLELRKAYGSWKSTVSVSANIANFDRSNPQYHRLTNPMRAIDDIIENQRDFDLDYHANVKIIDKPEILDPKVKENALAKLTQLLMLVDATNAKKVLIIGATNRPDSLDPALTRPGRLNQVIYLDLPSQQKRLDVLKFYSRSRVEGRIDWDHFSKDTSGLSPAHLQAAMNFSAIKAAYEIVENEQANKEKIQHTEDSIEYGIEIVKNTNAFSQGTVERLSQKLESFGAPIFLVGFGQMEYWSHVSLASPIKPISVPQPDMSITMAFEKLPSKKDTHVWNKIPDSIARTSFPTLCHNINQYVYKSLKKSKVVTRQIKPPRVNDPETQQKKRLRFFQRHRKAFRRAYLLTDPKTIDYSLLNNVTIDDHPLVNNGLSKFVDQQTVENFKLFKQYVKRVFKVHMFGSKLLLGSSYAVNNPLMFQTEYLYRKQNDKLFLSNSQFSRFGSLTKFYLKFVEPSASVCCQPDKIETLLKKMFGRTFALHRNIAYNANKALMVHLLTEETFQQEHMYDIWSRVKMDMSPEQYKRIFIKGLQENFVTRKQFENYLISLCAGKVGEHLMLYLRDAFPKYDPFAPRFGRYTYEVSEVGQQELRQISWLLNIMVEKNLFYGPHIDLTRQYFVQESREKLASRYNESLITTAVNKELWRNHDRKTYSLTHRYDKGMFVHKVMKLFQMQPPRSYWWSTDDMAVSIDFPYEEHSSDKSALMEWLRIIFRRKPRRYPGMRPNNLNYDLYRPHCIRTGALLENPYDAKYLPPDFVKAVTERGGTWNHATYASTERIARALLMDAFAKSCYVLAGHRELSDYISYYLIRRGKVQANKIKKLSTTFLEPEVRQYLEDIEKSEKQKENNQ